MTTLLFLAMLLGPFQLTQADPNCYKPKVGWVACAAPQIKVSSKTCITLDHKKYCFSHLPHCIPGWSGLIVNKDGGIEGSRGDICSADDSVTITPEKKRTGVIKAGPACAGSCGTTPTTGENRGGDSGTIVITAVRQWKDACNTCTEWSNGSTSCTLTMCLTQEQIDKAFPPESGICTGECMTHVWKVPEPAPEPEPEDVPAVMVTDGSSYVRSCREGEEPRNPGSIFQYCLEPRPTCTDKSRVLLTAEDGARWCHKINSGISGVIIDSGDHGGFVDSGMEPPKQEKK